jgi:dethiobiotin synthetase
LFISGTDTGVGKTWVTCLVARKVRETGLRVGVYKPACSGAMVNVGGRRVCDDVERLAAATGFPVPRDRVCPQQFAAPVAPPIAARLEDRRVDPQLLVRGALWWIGQVDLLLVEGAGGLLSPIGDDEAVADLAVEFGYPLLIVAADRLGTINHTLLTVEAAQCRGLRVAGIVVNRATRSQDASTAGNTAEIAQRCRAPVLGVVEFGSDQVLRPGGGSATIDWADLAAEAPPRDQEHDATD